MVEKRGHGNAKWGVLGALQQDGVHGQWIQQDVADGKWIQIKPRFAANGMAMDVVSLGQRTGQRCGLYSVVPKMVHPPVQP